MSVTFTKLFSSITESTIWTEPDHVRLVWITMLAMADSRGRVWASVPGLANRARVSVPHAASAIERLMSPDEWSRTPDNEGRRIEPIDGGWRLLNHAKYRAIRDEEAIKESKRNYISERRKKERVSNSVELCRHNAEADSEADTDPEKEEKGKNALPRPLDATNSADEAASLAPHKMFSGGGIDPDFVKDVWLYLHEKGWRDGGGHQVLVFWSYVERRWGRQKEEWRAKRKERTQTGKSNIPTGI